MTRKDVESLFKTHYTEMYHLALTLLFDEAESKDVVSDVFAHLLNKVRRDEFEIRNNDTLQAYLQTSVRNGFGLWGGMAFQVPRYVSFTHSSVSCAFPRMFRATLATALPCFISSSSIACSERSKNRLMISVSVIGCHLFSPSPVYYVFMPAH